MVLLAVPISEAYLRCPRARSRRGEDLRGDVLGGANRTENHPPAVRCDGLEGRSSGQPRLDARRRSPFSRPASVGEAVPVRSMGQPVLRSRRPELLLTAGGVTCRPGRQRRWSPGPASPPVTGAAQRHVSHEHLLYYRLRTQKYLTYYSHRSGITVCRRSGVWSTETHDRHSREPSLDGVLAAWRRCRGPPAVVSVIFALAAASVEIGRHLASPTGRRADDKVEATLARLAEPDGRAAHRILLDACNPPRCRLRFGGARISGSTGAPLVVAVDPSTLGNLAINGPMDHLSIRPNTGGRPSPSSSAGASR